jgi:DNA-binding Xre family transcriptional regulator
LSKLGDKTEGKVRKHLDAIFEIDGGWDVLLDIVHRRGVQRQLVEIRIAKGMKQADVAKRMDITQATLSEMETVRYPDFRLSTLRRWALALEARIEHHIFEIPKEEDEACEGET